MPSRRFLAALLLVLPPAAACRREAADDLGAERRVALPDSVGPGVSLRTDERGRSWIVEPGQATIVDTAAGATPSRIRVGGGTPLPAPRWDAAGRLYVDRGAAVLAALAHGEVTPAARPRPSGPVARDPRGRWIYVATRGGGVVGFDAEALRPRWGWPEAGGTAGALAVSPLGDRVYLALHGGGAEPRVQTRDAQTGRVLATTAVALPLRRLVPAADGTLYGYAEEEGQGAVLALRPVPSGVREVWRVSLERLGLEAPAELRVSPDGQSLAVFAREGGLRLLQAGTGKVRGESEEAPLDAVFDGAGRLHLLGPRELRVVR